MKDKLYQMMDWARIEGIVYGEEDHPEEILGAKPAGSAVLYQAFLPGAKKATLVLPQKSRRVAMELADEEGFFAAMAGRKPEPYYYEVQGGDGRIRRLKDPYAFRVKLKEEELKRFSQGIHYELHRLLGSREEMIDGVKGLRFTVWMPQAMRVSVVGGFNGWDGRACPMCRAEGTEVFTLFLPDLPLDTPYLYEVKLNGNRGVLLKTDDFAEAIFSEGRELSRPFVPETISWQDKDYREKKGREPLFFCGGCEAELSQPEELAHRLKGQGFTHYLLPCAGGNGNFYRFSAGFGKAHGVKQLVNSLHQAGIGVILQWEVGGLTDLGRKEISNIALAKLLYLAEDYHLDGVAFVNMAPLLYLDYGKEEGQWRPNLFGGNENLDAVEWIKHTNSILGRRREGLILIAGLDAIWPEVTQALEEGGLGFTYRYDTDFRRDYLEYLESDPYFRSGLHGKITERMLYAYQERFLMNFDGEESAALWERLTGDEEDKFRTMKLAVAYPTFLPGKLLLSFTVPAPYEEAFRRLVKDSHAWDYSLSPLEKEEAEEGNFRWINCFQHNERCVSFVRESVNGEGLVLVAANFAGTARKAFRLGVPQEGKYRLFFHTQDRAYGGSLAPDREAICSREEEWDGMAQSITLDLEALSLQAYIFVPYTEKELYALAEKKAEAIRLRLQEEVKQKVKQLKKSSLKDTLSRQVEAAEKAILAGSEYRVKTEQKQRKE